MSSWLPFVLGENLHLPALEILCGNKKLAIDEMRVHKALAMFYSGLPITM